MMEYASAAPLDLFPAGVGIGSDPAPLVTIDALGCWPTLNAYILGSSSDLRPHAPAAL